MFSSIDWNIHNIFCGNITWLHIADANVGMWGFVFRYEKTRWKSLTASNFGNIIKLYDFPILWNLPHFRQLVPHSRYHENPILCRWTCTLVSNSSTLLSSSGMGMA